MSFTGSQEDTKDSFVPPLTVDEPSTRPTTSDLLPSKEQSSKKVGSSTGLSELSKQLRILQSNNEAQKVEINRLERQLRILADLQGISVVELRNALEDACAKEAFGELQHRIAKLRAQLEAETLAKRAQIMKHDSASQISNLELRIGELEEIEEKQNERIRELYEQLGQEKDRSNRLQSDAERYKETENLQTLLDKEQAKVTTLERAFQELALQIQEEQQKKMEETAALARQVATNNAHQKDPGSSDLVEEYERVVKSLKEKDEEIWQTKAQFNEEKAKLMQQIKDLESGVHQSKSDMKSEHDKMALTIKQLEDEESQNMLRLAQYKARFAVQDERIQDMNQQLDSLYAAFGILRKDVDKFEKSHDNLRHSLNAADAEIARNMNVVGKPASKNVRRASHGGVPRPPPTAPPAIASPRTPTFDGSRVRRASGNSFFPTAIPTGPASPPPSPLQFFSPNHSSNSRSVVTPEPSLYNGISMWGTLFVKSKSMMRNWKKRSARLHLRGDHYQLDLDEKVYSLQFGFSKVEPNPNHPLSFVLHTNTLDPNAPVIYAATTQEQEYHDWMDALTKAT